MSLLHMTFIKLYVQEMKKSSGFGKLNSTLNPSGFYVFNFWIKEFSRFFNIYVSSVLPFWYNLLVLLKSNLHVHQGFDRLVEMTGQLQVSCVHLHYSDTYSSVLKDVSYLPVCCLLNNVYTVNNTKYLLLQLSFLCILKTFLVTVL